MLWAGTDDFSPMVESAYHTVFGWNCMMAVPMQILVSVCGLSIDSGVKSAIFIWFDQHIKERYGAIFSGFFTCELDVALKKNKGNTNNSHPNNSRNPKPHIGVPYHQGLSESFKRTCKKYGIQVHLKGGPTMKNLLMAPKVKDPIIKKSGVIYRYKCDRVECDEEYIGESARNFAERFREHLKAPFPIHDHSNISGHTVTIDNFSILGREDQNFMRTIKEALYIRVNNPSLNRNIGKYHLPHIWDKVLLNISELKLE